MKYDEFLNRILALGMEVSDRDGWATGLDICRGKDPKQLYDQWKRSARTVEILEANKDEDLEIYANRYKAVRWVCDIMSAALEMGKMPVIFQPSSRSFKIAQDLMAGDDVDEWRRG